MSGAVGGEKSEGNEKEDQAGSPGQSGGQDLASMPLMELGAGSQLGAVIRFDALFAIPPGAAAVEVIPDIRGADDRHNSPLFVEGISIAQIF